MDVNDVESLTRTARRLMQHPAGFALGAQLDTIARARETQAAQNKTSGVITKSLTEMGGQQLPSQRGMEGPYPVPPRAAEALWSGQLRPWRGRGPAGGTADGHEFGGLEKAKEAGLYEPTVRPAGVAAPTAPIRPIVPQAPQTGAPVRTAQIGQVRGAEAGAPLQQTAQVRAVEPPPVATRPSESLRDRAQGPTAREVEIDRLIRDKTALMSLRHAEPNAVEALKTQVADLRRRESDLSRAGDRRSWSAELGERVAIGAENRAQLAEAGKETRAKEKSADTTLNVLKAMERAAEDDRLATGAAAPLFAKSERLLVASLRLLITMGFQCPHLRHSEMMPQRSSI